MTERKRVSASAPTLDDLVAQAVDFERRLAALPRPRLTAEAFLAQALKAANATQADLDMLAARLPEVPGVRILIGDLAVWVRDGHLTAPPPPERARKLLAAGPASAAGDVAAVGASPYLVLAAAVAECNRRWPSAFGEVDDLTTLGKEAARLRDRLDATYAAMPAALRVDVDVDFDQTSLTNPERDRGLALVKFRRWPGVALAPDWPVRIVRAALAEPATEVAAA